MAQGLQTTPVQIGSPNLKGLLGRVPDSQGLVIFAHGSGSGRLSPRNNYVADALRRRGFSTLLLDLLTSDEEQQRLNVFDVSLLAERLSIATLWAGADERTAGMRLGYFGASTGAAAALVAAALPDSPVRAIVSRGGRPDLAGAALADVRAATLLIVGALDYGVIELNRTAFARLAGPKKLVSIPGATHLFEEPGALDRVVASAAEWFDEHL